MRVEEFGLCHETSLPGSSTVGLIARRSHSPQGHQTELACPKMDCRKLTLARRQALPPLSLQPSTPSVPDCPQPKPFLQSSIDPLSVFGPAAGIASIGLISSHKGGSV